MTCICCMAPTFCVGPLDFEKSGPRLAPTHFRLNSNHVYIWNIIYYTYKSKQRFGQVLEKNQVGLSVFWRVAVLDVSLLCAFRQRSPPGRQVLSLRLSLRQWVIQALMHSNYNPIGLLTCNNVIKVPAVRRLGNLILNWPKLLRQFKTVFITLC